MYNWDKNNFQPRIAVAWSPNYSSGLLHDLFGSGGPVCDKRRFRDKPMTITVRPLPWTGNLNKHAGLHLELYDSGEYVRPRLPATWQPLFYGIQPGYPIAAQCGGFPRS